MLARSTNFIVRLLRISVWIWLLFRIICNCQEENMGFISRKCYGWYSFFTLTVLTAVSISYWNNREIWWPYEWNRKWMFIRTTTNWHMKIIMNRPGCWNEYEQIWITWKLSVLPRWQFRLDNYFVTPCHLVSNPQVSINKQHSEKRIYMEVFAAMVYMHMSGNA